MIDWNSDPALKAMQDDFVSSLSTRREALAPALAQLHSGKPSEESITTLQFVAHKLGGAAGSYGFPTLSKVGGSIDDLLDLPTARSNARMLCLCAELLDDALQSGASGKDPSVLEKDSRLLQINATAERLLSGSKP